MLKRFLSIILFSATALTLFAGAGASVAASAPAARDASEKKPEGIVGEWLWSSTVYDAGADGAEKVFARYAEMGITDVYQIGRAHV